MVKRINQGWDDDAIKAVGRMEFQKRPLGGTYHLTFRLGPEVRLGSIEQIQLLMWLTYWVKQQ
ncbi:hypothetical protein [Pajaroellobacter abortibovis]|uniref:Uncharacterized protein n=1 Tax=Pajaroellobacter abortibovis TaxID=1882918 RepID=A0A1L6MWP6_9BACT|nr:hypothetical protein [Pajaroellobacter abortibovis]APR99953.1 hypothetical protein BCY86_04095 [Pajaroellobacter abortibovis]